MEMGYGDGVWGWDRDMGMRYEDKIWRWGREMGYGDEI